jgi:hypothetical protein
MSEDTIQTDGNGFFMERGGKRIAELHFRLKGNDLEGHHTWVDPELRGGDHARRLVQALVERARSAHRKVIPTCPYIRKTFERTPGYADVRAPDTGTRGQA